MLQKRDYLMTADLQDGYFHVLMKPKYRSYLGFQWRNQYYQYNFLPFGLAVFLWIFTKLVRPTIEYLKKREIRILAYMDDFILMASTLQQAISQRKVFLGTLQKLGWFISIEKSNLLPLQKQEFLGMQINTSTTPQYQISSKKLHNIKHEVSRILKIALKEKVPVRTVARIAGKCIAVTKAVLPLRMFLRNISVTTNISDI